MTELRKTALFLGAAIVLAAGAFYIQPERRNAALFNDEGEAFYPDFHDAQLVRSIEVIDYDEATATARPLKVEFKNRQWQITTNNDYPVDVGDRMVKTAAALIDLKKDQVKSESPQDHAKYGVIDPMDQKVSSLQGRGKRVTLRDQQKSVLADFILGKPVESKTSDGKAGDAKPGMRYIRVPGAKRTYAVKTDADPSARFSDWVNSGLLRMPQAQIRRVQLANYQVDAEGQLDRGETIILTQDNSKWSSPVGGVNEATVKTLVATLDGLKIVDARPKPAAMANDLRQGTLKLTQEIAVQLAQFGFLLTRAGQIMAVDGELAVEMSNGVAYQIRYGDVASQGADAKASGGDRYVFVTTNFDQARATRYGDTTGMGERTSKDLNARFAGWFYVISNADFQKLRLGRKELLK